jgi:hypothetical protein
MDIFVLVTGGAQTAHGTDGIFKVIYNAVDIVTRVWSRGKCLFRKYAYLVIPIQNLHILHEA